MFDRLTRINFNNFCHMIQCDRSSSGMAYIILMIYYRETSSKDFKLERGLNQFQDDNGGSISFS